MGITLRVSALSLCMVGGVLASAVPEMAAKNRFVGYETGTDCPRLAVGDVLFDKARDVKIPTPSEIMLNDAHWSVTVNGPGNVMPAFATVRGGEIQDSVTFRKDKDRCIYGYTRVERGGQVGISFILTKIRETDDKVQLMHGFETALQTLVKDYEDKGLSRAVLVKKMKAFEG